MKLYVFYLEWDVAASLEKAFYYSIIYNGSSGTHSRILFLPSPVFTAAFPLGERSSVLKSREKTRSSLKQ